jgi:hypothetical protein
LKGEKETWGAGRGIFFIIRLSHKLEKHGVAIRHPELLTLENTLLEYIL